MNSPVDLNFSEMREHCSIKLKKKKKIHIQSKRIRKCWNELLKGSLKAPD